ncbi:hypothetical protein BV20DRAFT_658889 [Pilatotrama ljubarskyi]|nr:hypothetical protein BV20DRAFT_658889 [Pilatotrama ljubarskyi]
MTRRTSMGTRMRVRMRDSSSLGRAVIPPQARMVPRTHCTSTRRNTTTQSFLAAIFDCSSYDTAFPMPVAPDAPAYDVSAIFTAPPSPYDRWHAQLLELSYASESLPNGTACAPQHGQIGYPAAPHSSHATAPPDPRYSPGSVLASLSSSPCIDETTSWTTTQPFPHFPPSTFASSSFATQGFAIGVYAGALESPSVPSPTPRSPDSLYSAPSPSSRDSSAAPQSRRTDGKSVSTTPRRNAVVHPSTSRLSLSSPADKYKCPYCDYVQRSGLGSQLKRHIKTHTRPVDTDDQPWVCCGVPLGDAQRYGVPQASGDPVEYEGMLFVGGCGKAFSRRDALKRHLRRNLGRCFGDSLGPWLRGNKDGGAPEERVDKRD